MNNAFRINPACPTYTIEKMTLPLASLSSIELNQLAAKIAAELRRRDRQRIVDARAQVLAIAQNLGMDVNDLLGKHSRDKIESKTVAIKYRNPADSQQQWTGRGRKPAWVKEWLASGKTLVDISI